MGGWEAKNGAGLFTVGLARTSWWCCPAAPGARLEVALRIVKLIDQRLHKIGGPKVAPIEVPESLDAEFADRLSTAIVSLRKGR